MAVAPWPSTMLPVPQLTVPPVKLHRPFWKAWFIRACSASTCWLAKVLALVSVAWLVCCSCSTFTASLAA